MSTIIESTRKASSVSPDYGTIKQFYEQKDKLSRAQELISMLEQLANVARHPNDRVNVVVYDNMQNIIMDVVLAKTVFREGVAKLLNDYNEELKNLVGQPTGVTRSDGDNNIDLEKLMSHREKQVQ